MSDDDREPVRILVFAASMRAGSLNAHLARMNPDTTPRRDAPAPDHRRVAGAGTWREAAVAR